MSSSNIPETDTAVVLAPAERRRSLRFPFLADVEMLEPSSGAKITGRTADLGLGGCYIDTLSPLPVGIEVKLKISRGNESFEAQARVIFSQIGMGMGVAFVSAQPSQIRTFQKWIQEITGTSTPLPEHDVSEAAAGPSQTGNSGVLSELILTLMKKKVLTESEGKDLLKKLFQ